MTPIIRAEILKLTTVRRTWLAGGLALLLTLLFLIVGLIFFGRAIGDETPPTEVIDRIALMASGVTFASMVVGVAGIQALASEFSTRSIIPSAVAVPRRSTLLNSKVAAFAIAALVFAAALAIITLFVGMVGLQIKDYPLGFGDHDMARVAIGMALVPVLYGLYGIALALLVGNSTLAIAILLVQATLGESAVGSFLPRGCREVPPLSSRRHHGGDRSGSQPIRRARRDGGLDLPAVRRGICALPASRPRLTTPSTADRALRTIDDQDGRVSRVLHDRRRRCHGRLCACTHRHRRGDVGGPATPSGRTVGAAPPAGAPSTDGCSPRPTGCCGRPRPADGVRPAGRHDRVPGDLAARPTALPLHPPTAPGGGASGRDEAARAFLVGSPTRHTRMLCRPAAAAAAPLAGNVTNL